MYTTRFYTYPADDNKVPYQWQVCFCYTCVHIYVLVFSLHPTCGQTRHQSLLIIFILRTRFFIILFIHSHNSHYEALFSHEMFESGISIIFGVSIIRNECTFIITDFLIQNLNTKVYNSYLDHQTRFIYLFTVVYLRYEPIELPKS